MKMSVYKIKALEDESLGINDVYEKNEEEDSLDNLIEYCVDDDDVEDAVQTSDSVDLGQHTLIPNPHNDQSVDDFTTNADFTHVHVKTECNVEKADYDDCIDEPQWDTVNDDNIVFETDEKALINLSVELYDQDYEASVSEALNMNVVKQEEEKFLCEDCKGVFDKMEEAEQHDCPGNVVSRARIIGEGDEAIVDYAFDCPFCVKQFNSLDNLNKHYLVCRKKPKDSDVAKNYKYKCPECFKTLYSLQTFMKHMRNHDDCDFTVSTLPNPKPKEKATCEICNTTFATMKNLKLHMKIHREKRDKSIQDAIPGDAVITYNEQNQFYCEICDKKFSENLLHLHKKMHVEGNEFNCNICNKHFDNSKLLDMHMESHVRKSTEISSRPQKPQVVKEGALLYPCSTCDYVFKRPYEKIKHERVHTGEKPYACEVCGKSFRVPYSLTIHLRTHTNFRPYECNICCKRFKSHPVLVHHQKIHTTERNYKCNMCEKSFRNSVQLSGHKNSHLKPFSCTECNRPFGSLFAVRNHMKTHENKSKSNELSRRMCNICGALYMRVYALNCHMKEAHNIYVEDAHTSAGVKDNVLVVYEGVKDNANKTAEQSMAEQQMAEDAIATQVITEGEEIVVNWFNEIDETT